MQVLIFLFLLATATSFILPTPFTPKNQAFVLQAEERELTVIKNPLTDMRQEVSGGCDKRGCISPHEKVAARY